MKARLVWYAIGAAVLYGLVALFGADKVSAYIQIIGAVPWFYTMYRIEELHRKHEEAMRDERRQIHD